MDDDTDIGGSGYTLDDLSDYRDRGRTPSIAAIEGNAECQAVLDALTRLHELSDDLLDEEGRASGAPDENWFTGIMDAIAHEFRAGRDIDFPAPDDATTLSITEGALRELIRSCGDRVPGVLIGRSRLSLAPDGAAHIDVTATAPPTRPLSTVAEEIRSEIATALARHTPLTSVRIDVTIIDIHAERGDE